MTPSTRLSSTLICRGNTRYNDEQPASLSLLRHSSSHLRHLGSFCTSKPPRLPRALQGQEDPGPPALHRQKTLQSTCLVALDLFALSHGQVRFTSRAGVKAFPRRNMFVAAAMLELQSLLIEVPYAQSDRRADLIPFSLHRHKELVDLETFPNNSRDHILHNLLRVS
eukprot:753318-Hanusia_phi.AAC.1